MFGSCVYLRESPSRRFATLHMTWQTKVAAWVIPLVADYLVPDDAEVLSDVELGTLVDVTSPATIQTQTGSLSYPGLIPNYSLLPTVRPKTDGTEYILRARKAVGFHSVVTTVTSYDSKKINSWTFPIDRKQFGYLALAKGSAVDYSGTIAYGTQIHGGVTAINLLASYDDTFDSENVFNDANKNSLDTAHIYLSPTVVIQVGFLPVWETWALKFKAVPLTCPEVRVFSLPPGVVGTVPDGGFREGNTLTDEVGNLWVLFCSSTTAPAPVWTNLGVAG